MVKLIKAFHKKSKGKVDNKGKSARKAKKSSGSIGLLTKILYFGDSKSKNKKKKRSKSEALIMGTSKVNSSPRSSGQNVSDPLLEITSDSSYEDNCLAMKKLSDVYSEDTRSVHRCQQLRTPVKDSGVFLFDGEDGGGVYTESNPSLDSFFYNIKISPIKEIDEKEHSIGGIGNQDSATVVLEDSSTVENEKRSGIDNFFNCMYKFFHNFRCARNRK